MLATFEYAVVYILASLPPYVVLEDRIHLRESKSTSKYYDIIKILSQVNNDSIIDSMTSAKHWI
jgi:hypothetical protein